MEIRQRLREFIVLHKTPQKVKISRDLFEKCIVDSDYFWVAHSSSQQESVKFMGTEFILDISLQNDTLICIPKEPNVLTFFVACTYPYEDKTTVKYTIEANLENNDAFSEELMELLHKHSKQI
jgi:hypothetical protein